MKRKTILIFFIVLCLNQTNKAQSDKSYFTTISSKKDLKTYKKILGKSYLDSSYFFVGNIKDYQKDMDFFLNTNLQMEDIWINGYTKTYSRKIGYKNNFIYKLPKTVKFAYIESVYLPLPFDLNMNKNTLKELIVRNCFIKGKDSVILDFSNLDSLQTLAIDHFQNKTKIYVNLKMPPNINFFITDMPLSYITSLPKSLEELVIARDTIYPFF